MSISSSFSTTTLEVMMFSFEPEEEEQPCELIRACRALHCPLCDKLFSSNEEDQRAPLILMCGHSICRACLSDGLSRMWNASPDDDDDDDGSGSKNPPCTCPECGESFAPNDDQATLPFFNAALACTVLQLQSLAKGMTFSPGAAPALSSASTSEAESSKETADVAIQTDDVLEEEYARQRWVPSEKESLVENGIDDTPSATVTNTAAAVNTAAPEEAASEPSKRQNKVPSTNPFECDSPRDPNVPLPAAAPKPAEGTVSTPSKRFSYIPVVIDKVALHDRLSQWVARCVIPPLLPGVSALRVHVSKDSPRVQKVVSAAEDAMIPVFVPFLSFSLMACINGREVYRDEKKNSQQFVTCAWELHSGRDAVNETIDNPLLWKQHQLRMCDPDERPRPGLWLPASTQNSDTIPKAMPRMPSLRTEAVVSPFAQELDKETRSQHESELQSCPNALTVRVIKPVLFYAPFWMASVKLPEFCAIVVNALNGKVVGSSTPLFDIVRDAKKEHKSSVDSAAAAATTTATNTSSSDSQSQE